MLNIIIGYILTPLFLLNSNLFHDWSHGFQWDCSCYIISFRLACVDGYSMCWSAQQCYKYRLLWSILGKLWFDCAKTPCTAKFSQKTPTGLFQWNRISLELESVYHFSPKLLLASGLFLNPNQGHEHYLVLCMYFVSSSCFKIKNMLKLNCRSI